MELNLVAVVGTLISLLFAGNIYFVKKLVDKVEFASSAAGKLNSSLEGFSEKLSDIKSEIKDLRKLEIDVAVMKSHMGLVSKNTKPGASASL